MTRRVRGAAGGPANSSGKVEDEEEEEEACDGAELLPLPAHLTSKHSFREL